MERKFTFETGEYYHIFNRGVEKRAIFLDDADRDRFIHLLYLTNSDKKLVFKLIQGLPLDEVRGETHTSIAAYSLMPNHFHFIAREDKEGGISAFMRKFSTSYSMYFNTKYERSGPLFCHPFRARHIHFDDYFRWLVSYIHLNPLDIMQPGWKQNGLTDPARAVEFLRSYRYSSYPDYFLRERSETKILQKDSLPISVADLESVEQMLKEHADPPEDCDTNIW